MAGIILGGITLNISMVWPERYTEQTVAMSVKRTLGGVPVIYSGKLRGGGQITLQSTEEYGWLRRSVVESLIALAAVAGATYTLSFNGTNYTVMFDSTSNSAVEMQPLTPRTADNADDMFIGQIHLLAL